MKSTPRPARKGPCGSTRCNCDHVTCDLGWTGSPEAARKCPACFPAPVSSTVSDRPVHPVATEEATFWWDDK